MEHKVIIKGWLEFGSKKSFEKIFKLFLHRYENYYKLDLLFNEEVFIEDQKSIIIPRFVAQAGLKTWKNTINALQYIGQFAVSGCVHAWMIEQGKILDQHIVEPKNERVAVQNFIRGKELINDGKEEEALSALNTAITTYEKHALAYERRGHINFRLENYKDALYDYKKSIKINDTTPEPFLGMARLNLIEEQSQKAVDNLQEAINRCIPLQPIYWTARKLKAETLLSLDKRKEALVDLKLFSNRNFTPDNPNFPFKKSITFIYGKTLIETEQAEEAIPVFEKVLQMPEGKPKVNEAEVLYHLGLARQKAGKRGYLKDWKTASKMGYKRATESLSKKS